MSSADKNLSIHTERNMIDVSSKKFAIIVAEWNEEITFALRDGACKTLIQYGAKPENIDIIYVPGSYELIYAAKMAARINNKGYAAIICIGCVIQGDTKHFDFICSAVADGLAKLNIDYNIPVIFGVLTPNTIEQAKDRAGGKHGNKGVEAAISAIKMVAICDRRPDKIETAKSLQL